MRKTIALFGATGNVGSEFLKLALDRGYSVKALVRSPEKLNITSDTLEVIQGDVLNPDDIFEAVKDTDIAISLFGHVKGSPEWLQTNGTKNILEAMQKFGVGRIISLSGGGLPFPEKDKPKFFDKLIRFVMKIAVPKILNDAIKHAEVLKNSHAKWVIVRGPVLTGDPFTGNYRIGWVGVGASTKIGRADLAHFLLSQIEDESFNFQMPFVSY